MKTSDLLSIHTQLARLTMSHIVEWPKLCNTIITQITLIKASKS